MKKTRKTLTTTLEQYKSNRFKDFVIRKIIKRERDLADYVLLMKYAKRKGNLKDQRALFTTTKENIKKNMEKIEKKVRKRKNSLLRGNFRK